MTTLYEFAGGAPAFTALAAAHHARCLADPELNHPFSKVDGDPHHLEHLAAYWGEVLGGPPEYSTRYGDEALVLSMHSGHGDMSDLGERFVRCFVLAADDAGLPEEPAFREALAAYMRWAVQRVVTFSPEETVAADPHPIPHWSWDGLQSNG